MSVKVPPISAAKRYPPAMIYSLSAYIGYYKYPIIRRLFNHGSQIRLPVALTEDGRRA